MTLDPLAATGRFLMAKPQMMTPAVDRSDTSHLLATPGNAEGHVTSHTSISPLAQFTGSREASSRETFESQQSKRHLGTATPDTGTDGTSRVNALWTENLPSDTPAHIMPKPVHATFPNLMKGSHGGSSASSDVSGSTSASTGISKADLLPTLASNLAPKSGFVPSQRPDATSVDGDGTPKTPVENPNRAPSSSTEIPSTPTGSIRYLPTNLPPGSTTVFSHTTPSSSSRKQHSYILPDGTVLSSGKGLGRGRPGIKRGPRKSKLGTEITPEITPEMTPSPDVTVESTDRKKRRHSDAKESAQTPPSQAEPSSRSTSPEFIPQATETRSGRQTQKPVSQVSQSASPASKKPRIEEPGSAKKALAFAKIKRKIYRGREHSALCEHCLRGHGPPNNVIVFCDACNKCWHQRCHDPPIAPEVVKDSQAEWFCAACDKIINGAKKSKKKAAPTLKLAPPLPVPMVGGSVVSREQRQSQLSNMSKEQLIDLLLHASDLAPQLPLFEDPTWDKNSVAATPTKPMQINDGYPTPTQETPGSRHTADDDEYEYFLDEHAALYPKPGNGVKLPPESKDLHILLERPACTTFSHKLYARSAPSN